MDGKNFNFQEAKQMLSLIDSKKGFFKIGNLNKFNHI